ncbi:MAG: activator of HSP90 ATPase 1 family protein [Saprospiraceae bacterium]|nr:activator of HSP90 ATPase 1 family protein [Saprospiraceae bacterium]
MKRVSFELEFIFKASPAIVYQFLTTPSCLVRWFCDEVDVQGDYYLFSWEGSTEIAEVVDDIEEERIRFRWLNADDEKEYFEFRIYKSRITEETVLEITDFCDDDEVADQKKLWESQLTRLRREAGGG